LIAVQYDASPETKRFAALVAEKLSAAINLKRVKVNNELIGVYPHNLGVLRAAQASGCPICILVESYFIDAYDDMKFCQERSVTAAKAISEAVLEWFK
jgi:hypothetical protein